MHKSCITLSLKNVPLLAYYSSNKLWTDFNNYQNLFLCAKAKAKSGTVLDRQCIYQTARKE